MCEGRPKWARAGCGFFIGPFSPKLFHLQDWGDEIYLCCPPPNSDETYPLSRTQTPLDACTPGKPATLHFVAASACFGLSVWCCDGNSAACATTAVTTVA